MQKVYKNNAPINIIKSPGIKREKEREIQERKIVRNQILL